MIEQWLSNLSGLLSQNLWLGLVIALLAGFLISFTPCSLSSIPLIIGYVSGYSQEKKKAFFYSLMYCAGLTITFTVIGVLAALIGRLFLGIMMYWYIFLGILMAFMALETWGVVNILPQNCGQKVGKKKGAIGAILLGIVGGFFASPCSTPVLIAILAVVSTGQSIVLGALMLLLYSVGHSILLIAAGTSVGWVSELSKSKKFEKAGRIIKIVMGFLLLALSLFLFYSAFA